MQVFEITECNEGVNCINSLTYKGNQHSLCGTCRFSPGNAGSIVYGSFWKPFVKGAKHPQQVEEKLVKKKARDLELRVRKQSVDKTRTKLLKKATLAEKQTERNIIRATKNSGRSNKDGDHKVNGFITLDTKLQTKRENPVVMLHELAKVQEDAKRAGNSIGGLVLRNKHGQGVVVLTEEGFAILSHL